MSRRWNARDRELEQDREHDARMGALLGLALIDVAYCRRTSANYHVACARFAPFPTAEIAVEPDRAGTCAHCSRAIT